MQPLTILQTKATSDTSWEVRQKFLRLGKYEVWVTGWGVTKAEALERFQDEYFWAEHPYDFDILLDMGNFLWEIAGAIDWLIKALRDFMQFIYNNSGRYYD